MRKFLMTWLAALALVAAVSPSAPAQIPYRHVPTPGHPTRPPWGYPGWPDRPWSPGYPRPWPPVYPPPQPPIQIRYTVFYRATPFSGWHVYARYASHHQAAHTARWLRGYGYETDVVVTY